MSIVHWANVNKIKYEPWNINECFFLCLSSAFLLIVSLALSHSICFRFSWKCKLITEMKMNKWLCVKFTHSLFLSLSNAILIEYTLRHVTFTKSIHLLPLQFYSFSVIPFTISFFSINNKRAQFLFSKRSFELLAINTKHDFVIKEISYLNIQ